MPHTLLLADDSVTIQRVIELTFADEDVRVIAVSNGDEAIALLNRTPPDIVLADVGMPGPSGYDIAQHIKDTPNLAHIPVVLLTGAFEPIDQAKATAVGCDGVLAKPFEPQLVIGRVKELLAKPKRPAAAPSPAAPPPPAPERARCGRSRAPPEGPRPTREGGAGCRRERLFRIDSTGVCEPLGPETMKTALPSVGADIDWFGSKSQTPTCRRRRHLGSSLIAESAGSSVVAQAADARFDRPARLADRRSPPRAPYPRRLVEPLRRRSRATRTVRALPPLADAFAALLAASSPLLSRRTRRRGRLARRQRQSLPILSSRSRAASSNSSPIASSAKRSGML